LSETDAAVIRGNRAVRPDINACRAETRRNIGEKNAGGIFGPSLFIGAMVGA